MKFFQNTHFAKQLIICVTLVLLIVFFLISLALTNSVQQFIDNNAYNQAKTFAKNIEYAIDKELSKIENLPKHIYELQHLKTFSQASEVTFQLLKYNSGIIGCSIHFAPNNPIIGKYPHISAYRTETGNIEWSSPCTVCEFYPLPPKYTFHCNLYGGYWIRSQINNIPTLAYCYPLNNTPDQHTGMLKVEYPLHSITQMFTNYELYKFSSLFIMDREGSLITYTDLNHSDTTEHSLSLSELQRLKQNIPKGETGSMLSHSNNIKYFIYYTSLTSTFWQMGIICPYDEILYYYKQLNLIIFFCLGGGLLFLFAGLINIIHHLSQPLRSLAYIARQMADGRLNTEIPILKSSIEINELYDSFRYLQCSIINYIERLKISTAEREQRNTEMNLARRIQQRLLPRPLVMPANIELAAELKQSREVGGDLYEFMLVGECLFFSIGDVAGKGTPAALYMASVGKLFRYIAGNNTSTATICNILNKLMWEDMYEDMYITMFMGILDLNTGILTFTNAGHPYPVVIHENGYVHFLEQHQEIPLGVIEDHCFTENTYTLHKGTSMLLYTDGITDAESNTGQFYGKEKMLECLQAVATQSPEDIVQAILEDIRKHIGTRDLSDDLTLLMLRYKGFLKDKLS